MDDTRLLENAARAIGRQIIGWNQQSGTPVAVLDDESFWQPLEENGITDCMGDALRLAVRVKLRQAISDEAWVIGRTSIGEYEQDPYAAARRAITRAAAEIGKAMP